MLPDEKNGVTAASAVDATVTTPSSTPKKALKFIILSPVFAIDIILRLSALRHGLWLDAPSL